MSVHREKIDTVTAPDGNLPATLDKLHAAIAGLADPVKGWYADGVKLGPSLYEQLDADVAAKPGDGYGKGRGAALAPCYMDALDLRTTIDAAIRRVDPAGSTTLDRLHRIASGRYRPQDAERLERLAADLEQWTAAIRALLDPEHVKSVSAPCPACGASTAYRVNKIGERVRQAALQIVAATGCRCLACGTHWPPEQYMWLVKVLGFETPAGVLG